jgi:hypothetical protein
LSDRRLEVNTSVPGGHVKADTQTQDYPPAAMFSTDATLPPFVVVDGIANFRDIGGYSTSTGQSITKGLAFRCADPSKVTPEGLNRMSEDLGKVKLTHALTMIAPAPPADSATRSANISLKA